MWRKCFSKPQSGLEHVYSHPCQYSIYSRNVQYVEYITWQAAHSSPHSLYRFISYTHVQVHCTHTHIQMYGCMLCWLYSVLYNTVCVYNTCFVFANTLSSTTRKLILVFLVLRRAQVHSWHTKALHWPCKPVELVT